MKSEPLYYKHDPNRLSACPLTIHALLHIAWGIRVAGPVWTYWAYPMERHYSNRSEADATPTHLSVHLSLQNHSSIKSNYYMIYMKYYAWIPTRTKPPNLYMFRVSSANHIFLLLVTHAKCKQIRTISLLPPDIAKSCPWQYKARFSLV